MSADSLNAPKSCSLEYFLETSDNNGTKKNTNMAPKNIGLTSAKSLELGNKKKKYKISMTAKIFRFMNNGLLKIKFMIK